ncbi:MAG: hypothetical protein AB7S26_14255 [Sandaracinaceae bacterium]
MGTLRTALQLTLGVCLAIGCDSAAPDCECRATADGMTVQLACGTSRCVLGHMVRCDEGAGLTDEGACMMTDSDAGPMPPMGLCSDTCASAGDGECDDGGEGALYDVCALGTDCADCGPRNGTCTPSCSGRSCGDDGCGGSCGTCSSGSCMDGTCVTGGCTGGPRCEGDVAVHCEDIGGTPATIRETCAERCEGGMCVVTPPPTSVTIRGSYGSTDPIYAGTPPDLSGLVQFVATPSFTPDVPSLPNLFSEHPASVSPDPGGCTYSTGFTLNRSQVSAQLSGTGSACVLWFDRIARDGITLTFDDAPLQTASGTIDVTLELTP